MTKKQYTISNIVLVLIEVIFLFELIRDSNFTGDFLGYVNAGNLVLNSQNIYSDYLNTWPPLFSIFSVPISLLDAISGFLSRFLWLLGSIISLLFVVKYSVKIFFNETLSFKPRKHSIMVQDALVVIPLVILSRFTLDNLTNIQINIYMLLLALLSVKFFIQKKHGWAGFLLALTISLKVYTIFFLFYFLFKREFKTVSWTIVFVILLNVISFLVFGFDQATEYYLYWMKEVAPRSYMADFNNQSVFGAFLRLFTPEYSEHKWYTNLMSLDPYTVKKITYMAVVLVAVFPIILFRKKLQTRNSLRAFLEYSVVFTAIPILSPVSWKAYFIFLWIPYFLLYAILYRTQIQEKPVVIKWMKGLYWFSVVLNVGSTELILGRYLSDVMEVYSAITIGSIILIGLQLFILARISRYNSAFRFAVLKQAQ